MTDSRNSAATRHRTQRERYWLNGRGRVESTPGVCEIAGLGPSFILKSKGNFGSSLAPEFPQKFKNTWRNVPLGLARTSHGWAFSSPVQCDDSGLLFSEVKTYPKVQLRQGVQVLRSAAAYLRTTYGPGTDADIDLRPWVSRDHPIAMAHWILVQKRIKAVSMLRRAAGSPEAQERKQRALTRGKTALAMHSASAHEGVAL
jgi:hypothetical protein